MLAPAATSLLPLIREAATHALAIAADAPPHAPRRGEDAASLTDALPLAAKLLGHPPAEHASACVPPPETRINDGRGQTRPAYRWLWTHLHARATGVRPVLKRGATNGRIDEPAEPAAPPAALHPTTPDDSPDAWTFRELSELHELAWQAARTDDGPLRERVISAARYHVAHTQPDYTTYQPWALGAFLFEDDTAGFAEQQLHDVRSHLAIEGGASAVVPALLLADAVHLIETCRAGHPADPAEV